MLDHEAPAAADLHNAVDVHGRLAIRVKAARAWTGAEMLDVRVAVVMVTSVVRVRPRVSGQFPKPENPVEGGPSLAPRRYKSVCRRWN